MNFLTLLKAFFRVNVTVEFAYRFNFFIQLIQSILSLIVGLGGLAIIFSYTDSLGGWKPDEVLALIGVYFLVGGMIGLTIQPAMEQLIESVRDGKLDFTLTKPADAQLLISIRSTDIWKLIDMGLGLAVLFIALARLGEQVGGISATIFVIMLLAGGVIIYGFWLMLATLSFWFVRIENILVIFQSMYEAGRWPITLYPPWLRFALTFIVPVAFAVTVPAEALIGRLTWQTALITLALSVALFVISRIFWRYGLKHYSGASA